jgi:hypothetical protein
MGGWDTLLLNKLPFSPRLFLRFIDDVLMVFDYERQAEVALAAMQNLDPHIRVGEFTIGKEAHFLDLSLALVRNDDRSICWNIPNVNTAAIRRLHSDRHHVRISLYRKPTDLIAVLNFASAHGWCLKVNVLYSQCVRILRNSNDLRTAGHDVGILLHVMSTLRNVPSRTIRRLVSRLHHWLAEQALNVGLCAMATEANRVCFTCLRVAPTTGCTPFTRVLRNWMNSLSFADRAAMGCIQTRFTVNKSLLTQLSYT